MTYLLLSIFGIGRIDKFIFQLVGKSVVLVSKSGVEIALDDEVVVGLCAAVLLQLVVSEREMQDGTGCV